MTFLSDSNKIAEQLRANRPKNKANTQADEASIGALADFDSLPNFAHVRLPVVAGLCGISEPTVWRWVKSGHLPAPRKLGPNTTAWNVGELRAKLRTAA